MKCKTHFVGKISKNIINLPSAKLAHRVFRLKMIQMKVATGSLRTQTKSDFKTTVVPNSKLSMFLSLYWLYEENKCMCGKPTITVMAEL